ncbi:MAG TPA: Glu/Leu/Phe/Val dehydrogenase [Nitriliruptorales bacterium]|nr:Glu/Leu/Phe/Val dehydrogenase [Nitriliruptorales bacterium]
MEGPFSLLRGHEQVLYTSDDASGLRCIIAIHSTALGPSLGGTRFYPYRDERAALIDVLRLSHAMTYKAACAGLMLGGGKAAIIGDPDTDKSEALLRAYGRAVDSLGGRYITACDVGTYPRDMTVVAQETRWVTGMDPEHGGSGDSGVTTAFGVFVGVKAVAEHLWGSDSLEGRHVSVQGLGKVGARLAEHLAEAGAKLTVTDVDPEALDRTATRLGAEVVTPDEILDVDADVFSPNALGAVLTEATIPRLEVAAICGGANNQLGAVEDAARCQERGILYAPDYVVNAGGMIQVSDELTPGGYSHARTLRKAEHIGVTLREIFALAREQSVTTELAAERVAERRIAAIGRLRGFYLREPSRRR